MRAPVRMTRTQRGVCGPRCHANWVMRNPLLGIMRGRATGLSCPAGFGRRDRALRRLRPIDPAESRIARPVLVIVLSFASASACEDFRDEAGKFPLNRPEGAGGGIGRKHLPIGPSLRVRTRKAAKAGGP